MALALNNLKRVDMPLKTKKPNLLFIVYLLYIYYIHIFIIFIYSYIYYIYIFIYSIFIVYWLYLWYIYSIFILKGNMRLRQKFHNIWEIWDTIVQLWMHLLRLSRWQTTLNIEMLCLPDTLWLLPIGFAFMAWNTTLESTLLGWLDLAWLLRFLHPE